MGAYLVQETGAHVNQQTLILRTVGWILELSHGVSWHHQSQAWYICSSQVTPASLSDQSTPSAISRISIASRGVTFIVCTCTYNYYVHVHTLLVLGLHTFVYLSVSGPSNKHQTNLYSFHSCRSSIQDSAKCHNTFELFIWYPFLRISLCATNPLH